MTLQEWVNDDTILETMPDEIHFRVNNIYISVGICKMNSVYRSYLRQEGEVLIDARGDAIKEAKLALLRKYKQLLQNQLDILEDIEL